VTLANRTDNGLAAAVYGTCSTVKRVPLCCGDTLRAAFQLTPALDRLRQREKGQAFGASCLISWGNGSVAVQAIRGHMRQLGAPKTNTSSHLATSAEFA